MPGAAFISQMRAAFVKRAQGASFSAAFLTTNASVSGAVTANSRAGRTTTEALTTAGVAAFTLTVTCDHCGTDSIIVGSVANGTNTQGTPAIGTITPAAGSFVLTLRNLHASQALNGTVVISWIIENPS